MAYKPIGKGILISFDAKWKNGPDGREAELEKVKLVYGPPEIAVKSKSRRR